MKQSLRPTKPEPTKKLNDKYYPTPLVNLRKKTPVQPLEWKIHKASQYLILSQMSLPTPCMSSKI